MAAFWLPIPPKLQPQTTAAVRSPAPSRNALCGMSFFARRGGIRMQRQAHAKVRARLGFENLDAAAMGIDEFRDHGEPDAGALDVPALGGLALIERLEDAVALLGGDPWAAVHDVHDQ